MKNNLFIIFGLLSLVCFSIPNVSAQTIAVVKGASIRPYNETLKGYKEVMGTDLKEFVLSGENANTVLNDIHEARPDLIFAIGQNALITVKGIRDIPIVYAMVSSPKRFLSDENNITGISMNISAERQLNELINILPNARNVGIVYDPQKTAQLFDEVRNALVSRGLSVRGQAIDFPAEAPDAINCMKDKIDVFWMLPDTTVITKETLEYLFLSSIEKGVPVLAFSDKYLGMGALLALTIDARDIGRQAGELSRRVLSGEDASKIRINSPRKARVSINFKIAEKLGINVNKGIHENTGFFHKRELK